MMLLLAALWCCCFSPAAAQVEDILIDKAIDIAVDEIPSIILDDGDLDDPGGPVDTTFDWTEIWRSSDLPGERGTQRRGPDDWEARPQGKRKGCICMDGTEQRHRGRGACSGRGGVRYWIYETPEGRELTHPTARHYLHPDPLTSDEKLGLAAYNEEKDPPSKKRTGMQVDSFVSLAIVLASLTMVIFFMRYTIGQRRETGNKEQQDGPENPKN